MTDQSSDPRESAGRPQSLATRPPRTRAGLVVPDVRGHASRHRIDARAAEFVGLAEAIDLDIAFVEVIKLREIRPATYLSAGHLAAVKEKAKAGAIDLLLIDAPISPIQQRNLEKETGAKVLDRTGLILEIFGERAATREGVLQVELAHLKYQRGRLVRSWTHLERQRGGFGFLGGPGETQIESDRRLLQDRIKLLEERLEKVRQTRAQQKGRRDAASLPVVAIAGYTNAGKSSIFNALTGEAVFAADQLFATLDTTLRKIELPHGREVMLSDTVGFVSDLPTELVAAFRATLEEVVEADVILHVRDISNPDHPAQAKDVLAVLADLGVEPEQVPIIEVWNKIDLLARDGTGAAPTLATAAPAGKVAAVVQVSARTGEGLDKLRDAIEAALAAGSRTFRVHVPHEAGADVGWLYGHAEIIGREEPDELGQVYEVRIDPRHKAAFTSRFGGRIEP
ncbi:MAG TPA: GTPase HflX [Alphaproteobacteria bacterium]|nr:GTPase HflX [Alphaproteobacteria bacterium]